MLDGMLKRKGGTTERQNEKYVVLSTQERRGTYLYFNAGVFFPNK